MSELLEIIDVEHKSPGLVIEEFLRAYDIEYVFNQSMKAYQVKCPFCKSDAYIMESEKKIYVRCMDTDCENEHMLSSWEDFKQEYAGRPAADLLENSVDLIIKHVGMSIGERREPEIERNKNGAPYKTAKNCVEVISYDNELYGHIGYNLLSGSQYILNGVPWDKDDKFRQWSDRDDSELRIYIETKYGIDSRAKIQDAFIAVSGRNERKFNPITVLLEYIHHAWKRRPTTGAIKKLLPYYMGAEDSEYTFEVMKLFMFGAISRAYTPGCKFDYMPIFTGAQGMGKSTFGSMLALNDNWFIDDIKDICGKDAQEKLRGKWIVEFGELQAFSKAEVTELKSWITRKADDYREPYSKRASSHPRMCVFMGTTNEQGFLRDKTGNRRYLPVVCNEDKGHSIFEDMEAVKTDICNAWGEAMEMYFNSEKRPSLVLPEHLQEEAVMQQNAHMEEDYRIGAIQSWLESEDIEIFCTVQIMDRVFSTRNPSRLELKQVREIVMHQLKNVKIYDGSKDHRKLFTEKGTDGKPYGKQDAFVHKRSFLDNFEGELIFD